MTAKSIKLVDGKGKWILTGEGQDLEITEKKDGDGSLTLLNFGKITIKEKNGKGNLMIEANNGEVEIKKMDGDGHAALRNPGAKTVKEKNGNGNIYYKGMKPDVQKMDGNGKVIPE